MKKTVIGYIYDHKKFNIEDKLFFKVAKKLNIELVPINVIDEIIEPELEEKARKCNILLNDVGDDPIVIEIVKTFEELGKKVIEPSKDSYYDEDKWIFFMKCKKNNIPTPETILLPTNLDNAKKELIRFAHWPIILKRIYGCRGEFVDKADTIEQAMKIIKHFWEKSNERSPIIAQEYVLSDSYRVTVINKKIVQTTIKRRGGWKAVGHANKKGYKFQRFKVDNEIKKLVNKIINLTEINICGIDFAKKEGKWVVIEVNAEPCLKFFDCEHEQLIEDVLKTLKKLV